jgi:hypothetical protein
MNRKILSPKIIEDRLNQASKENIWFFIKKINNQLVNNPIKLDKSIDVIADYWVDESFIHRLIDLYKAEGWERIEYRFTEPENGFQGKTIVSFYPPE